MLGSSVPALIGSILMLDGWPGDKSSQLAGFSNGGLAWLSAQPKIGCQIGNWLVTRISVPPIPPYRHTDTNTDTRMRFILIPIPILEWWFILIPISILLKPSYRYRYWYRYRYGTDTDTDTRYIYMLCAWYWYHTETGPHLGVEFFGVS